MKKEEIQQAYNQLSNEKKDVLVRFLKGQTDQEIAAEIHCSRDNVRKHIQTLIEDFKLKQKGEGKKDRRNELIALFAQHKPELFIDDEGREKQTKVAISYWQAEDPDGILAEHLNETLATAGYQTFLLGLSLRNSKYGSQQIEAIIRLCDYFVILLSEISAVREMIEEEVKIAYSLQDAQLHKKPKISVILVNCDWNFLSYDLQGYLSKFPRYQWNSKTNSDSLIQDVLNQLAGYSIQETTPELIAFTPKSNPRPLPSADPELPGGQVDLNSTYYVERDRIEKRCYAEIIRPGALIRIKAPRQMGKTSLMSRILYHAQQSGYRTIALSCQLAGSQAFENIDTFLWWFCNQVGRHFHLENAINQYWSGKIITERCHYYFEDCLLPQLETNLVVGLDEIDRVFPHQEIAQDFLGLVRFWFEKAKSIDATGKLWKRFNLVLVHSTEVYIPLPINQSPFNVGMAIDLRPFNYREVQELSRLHRLDFSEEKLQQLIELLGGHPFLLRLAFYEIQCENQTLETILETAHTEAGIYSDHLGRHLWNLQRHPELLAAFEQVIDEESIQLEQSLAFKLKSMGLVHYQGNRVTVSCNLYRLYFTERLTA